jgi:hypothetical protein
MGECGVRKPDEINLNSFYSAFCIAFLIPNLLDSFRPPDFSEKLNCLKRRQYKNLAVSNLAFRPGSRGFDDRVHRSRHKVVVDHNLKRDLPQKMTFVLMPAVHFRLPTLPRVALGITDSHSSDCDAIQCLPHCVELRRLNDCNDKSHRLTYSRRPNDETVTNSE